MTDIPIIKKDGEAPQIPVRSFLVRVAFETGQGLEMKIQSLDHVGALAKALAGLADIPVRVSRLEFKDVTDSVISQVQHGFPLGPPKLPPTRQ